MMKQLLCISTIIWVLFPACSPNNSASNPASASKSTVNSQVPETLIYQKRNADSIFKFHNENINIWIKFNDKDEPLEVKTDTLPKNIKTIFNILKDSTGQIISIAEIPFSESGDWNIRLTHYFDKAGNTVAFERKADFYNSICTNGIARETYTSFYSIPFQLMEEAYTLVDEENKILPKDSCQFPYNYPYTISENMDKYLLTNNLKAIHK